MAGASRCRARLRASFVSTYGFAHTHILVSIPWTSHKQHNPQHTAHPRAHILCPCPHPTPDSLTAQPIAHSPCPTERPHPQPSARGSAQFWLSSTTAARHLPPTWVGGRNVAKEAVQGAASRFFFWWFGQFLETNSVSLKTESLKIGNFWLRVIGPCMSRREITIDVWKYIRARSCCSVYVCLSVIVCLPSDFSHSCWADEGVFYAISLMHTQTGSIHLDGLRW